MCYFICLLLLVLAVLGTACFNVFQLFTIHCIQMHTNRLFQVPLLKTFTFSMAEIRELWGEPAGKDLYFLGTMTDYYYLETLTGTAVTHVVKDGIRLKILGREIRTFKPGVPFNIQVGYRTHTYPFNGPFQISVACNVCEMNMCVISVNSCYVI